MKPTSESAGDGLSLLTDFKVTPALTDRRQLWLTWSWKSSSLAEQLFQQLKLIHQNDLDLQLLGENVITNPAIQSYAIGNLRPNIEYLVCLRLTRRRMSGPTDPTASPPLATTSNGTLPPKRGHQPANLTGYVAEMECRLAKTQGLHWPAFISSLLGIVVALVFALAVYIFVRHWQAKTREKYHQELQQQHHHHHHHHHFQHRGSHPQGGKCGHKSGQSVEGEGRSIQSTAESCAKHCHRLPARRQTGSGEQHRGGSEATGGTLGEEAGECLLLPPTCHQLAAPLVEALNTHSPGLYSLSGSESYQITSTSSTMDENACCNGLDQSGSASAQKPLTGQHNSTTGDSSEGRHSQKSLTIGVQSQQNRRTVSFLVSENSLSQGTGVPEKQRHFRQLSIRQASDPGRSNLKVVSPHPGSLPQSQLNFIDSPKDASLPSDLSTSCYRDANTSDLPGSLLGDSEGPPPVLPSNYGFTSPILSVPETPTEVSNASDTGCSLPRTEYSELGAHNSQTECDSAAVGKETSPVFYTQLIETI